MSEHAWVEENMASYMAGGLDAAERERLEQHAGACPPCARELDDALGADRSLASLFAAARPEPGLEDRMIRGLRSARAPRGRGFFVYAQVGLAAAAVLLFGAVGAVLSQKIEQGALPFPGGALARRATQDTDVSHVLVMRSDTEGVPPLAAEYRTNSVDYFQAVPHFDAAAAPPSVDELAQQTRANAIADLQSESQTANRTGLERESTVALGYRENPASGRDLAERSEAAGIDLERWRYNRAKGTTLGQVAGTTPFTINAPVGNPTVVFGADKDGRLAEEKTRKLSRQDNGKGLADNVEALVTTPYYAFSDTLGKERLGEAAPAAPALDAYFKPALVTAAPVAPEAATTALTADPAAKARQEPAASGQTAAEPKTTEPAPANPRKIIRSGEIEFEIDSFDTALDTIMRIANEDGAIIATVNSEKLANGKVRGTVTVRVPPERLDTLLLKLRALGDLKGQRIASQDVTKQYTDLESRLRAARAMEERLLEMIRKGDGEIKDLLEAEKELGVWRTKIEEFEGELRYTNSLIALSTLTVTLTEREIRAPFSVTETERIQMGIEVEDVEQAQQAVLEAVRDANGRVRKSELKKHAAEQFSAVIEFEVPPDAAGTVRDRLRQLGHVSRLDIDRLEQTEGGTGRPQDAKTKRADTQFAVSLYNLANVAPRETVHISIAARDAEAAYRAILAAVEKASGRVVTSNLNRQPNEQTTGAIQFEVKTEEADRLLDELKASGEVMRMQMTENPDAQNVTRAKRGFDVQLWAMGTVPPRETVVIQLATRDVPASYHALQQAVEKTGGRMLAAQLNEQDKENVTAQVDFEAPRDQSDAVATAIAAAGDIFSRNATRSSDKDNVIDSKLRWQLSLVNQAKIPPRETTTLGIEVSDVDKTAEAFADAVARGKGRTVAANLAHERNGRVTAKLVFDVPLAASFELVQRFKQAGTVRAQQSSRNSQVPESELAIARLDVTLSNSELIVPGDEGLWSQIRRGLATSFVALSWSLIVVIVGVCFVLPWVLLIYLAYRIVQRIRRRAWSTPAAA